mmetsp:Transcript_14360/g.51668  ORF Transcript_14360/g.51668 Transcript_14360/m.51668 type:complete len:215 (-) Transcript_14360:1864-2508(-)
MRTISRRGWAGLACATRARARLRRRREEKPRSRTKTDGASSRRGGRSWHGASASFTNPQNHRRMASSSRVDRFDRFDRPRSTAIDRSMSIDDRSMSIDHRSGSSTTSMISSMSTFVSTTSSPPPSLQFGYLAVMIFRIFALCSSLSSISVFACFQRFHSSMTARFSAARCESCSLRMLSSSSSNFLLYFFRFFAISASFSGGRSDGARGRHRNW